MPSSNANKSAQHRYHYSPERMLLNKSTKTNIANNSTKQSIINNKRRSSYGDNPRSYVNISEDNVKTVLADIYNDHHMRYMQFFFKQLKNDSDGALKVLEYLAEKHPEEYLQGLCRYPDAAGDGLEAELIPGAIYGIVERDVMSNPDVAKHFYRRFLQEGIVDNSQGTHARVGFPALGYLALLQARTYVRPSVLSRSESHVVANDFHDFMPNYLLCSTGSKDDDLNPRQMTLSDALCDTLVSLKFGEVLDRSKFGKDFDKAPARLIRLKGRITVDPKSLTRAEFERSNDSLTNTKSSVFTQKKKAQRGREISNRRMSTLVSWESEDEEMEEEAFTVKRRREASPASTRKVQRSSGTSSASASSKTATTTTTTATPNKSQKKKKKNSTTLPPPPPPSPAASKKKKKITKSAPPATSSVSSVQHKPGGVKSTRSNGPAEIVVDFSEESTPKKTRKSAKKIVVKPSNMEVDSQEQNTEPTTPMDTTTTSPQPSPISSPSNEEQQEAAMEEESHGEQVQEEEQMYDSDDTIEVEPEARAVCLICPKEHYQYQCKSCLSALCNVHNIPDLCYSCANPDGLIYPWQYRFSALSKEDFLPCEEDRDQKHVSDLYPFVQLRCYLNNEIKMSPAFGARGSATSESGLPISLLKETARYFHCTPPLQQQHGDSSSKYAERSALENSIYQATELPAWLWHTRVLRSNDTALYSSLAMSFLPPYHKPMLINSKGKKAVALDKPGYIHGFDLVAALSRQTDVKRSHLIPPLAPELLPTPADVLKSSRLRAFPGYSNRQLVGIILNANLSGRNTDVWTDWADHWVGCILDYDNATVYVYNPTGKEVEGATMTWLSVLMELFKSEPGMPDHEDLQFVRCEHGRTYKSYTGLYVLLWMLQASIVGKVEEDNFKPLEEITQKNFNHYLETFFNFFEDDKQSDSDSDEEEEEDEYANQYDDKPMVDANMTAPPPPVATPKATSTTTSSATHSSSKTVAALISESPLQLRFPTSKGLATTLPPAIRSSPQQHAISGHSKLAVSTRKSVRFAPIGSNNRNITDKPTKKHIDASFPTPPRRPPPPPPPRVSIHAVPEFNPLAVVTAAETILELVANQQQHSASSSTSSSAAATTTTQSILKQPESEQQDQVIAFGLIPPPLPAVAPSPMFGFAAPSATPHEPAPIPAHYDAATQSLAQTTTTTTIPEFTPDVPPTTTITTPTGNEPKVNLHKRKRPQPKGVINTVRKVLSFKRRKEEEHEEDQQSTGDNDDGKPEPDDDDAVEDDALEEEEILLYI